MGKKAIVISNLKEFFEQSTVIKLRKWVWLMGVRDGARKKKQDLVDCMCCFTLDEMIKRLRQHYKYDKTDGFLDSLIWFKENDIITY